MTRTSTYRLVPTATTSASLIGHRGRVTMASVNGFFITVNSQNLKFISIDFIFVNLSFVSESAIIYSLVKYSKPTRNKLHYINILKL